MPMSVRLGPALEELVSQEAWRRSVSKSEFVKDAIERALGLKDPGNRSTWFVAASAWANRAPPRMSPTK